MKTSLFSLGASMLLLSGLALAQPDAANAPKAQNPANVNMGGGPGGRGGRRNNLTPAQRDQLMAQAAQIRDITQRQTLTLAGVTDVKAQDAIIAFLKEQDTARQSLQQKWMQLAQSLRGDDVNNTVLVTQLNALRDAVDEEKARRTKALADLDAQIGFSKNPKLDAMLMVAGITGDEAYYAMGASTNGGGRGGNAGFGGAGNGGFGFGGGMGGFGGGGMGGFGGGGMGGGGGFGGGGFGGGGMGGNGGPPGGPPGGGPDAGGGAPPPPPDAGGQ